jgi:hypothetical protein
LTSYRETFFFNKTLLFAARFFVCAKNMLVNVVNPDPLTESNQMAAVKEPAGEIVSERDPREQFASEHAKNDAEKTERDFHFNSSCESW